LKNLTDNRALIFTVFKCTNPGTLSSKFCNMHLCSLAITTFFLQDTNQHSGFQPATKTRLLDASSKNTRLV
jgi:hypothetical protein